MTKKAASPLDALLHPILTYPGVEVLSLTRTKAIVSFEGWVYEIKRCNGQVVQWRIDTGDGYTDSFFAEVKHFVNRYLRKVFSVPFNSNKKWTDHDISVFDEMVALNCTLEQISDELDRSTLSVKVRLADITGCFAWKYVEDDDYAQVPVDDVTALLNQELNAAIEREIS
ncbi:MAG: hypothetical protein AWU57_57 [Marinobacter sp. T13-3]|nr:MAG: hypothetical protein AWU57_57 [Marinobacter sp. T13-3]